MCHVAVLVCVIRGVVFIQMLVVDCKVNCGWVSVVVCVVASKCVGDDVDLLQEVLCVDLL